MRLWGLYTTSYSVPKSLCDGASKAKGEMVANIAVAKKQLMIFVRIESH